MKLSSVVLLGPSCLLLTLCFATLVPKAIKFDASLCTNSIDFLTRGGAAQAFASLDISMSYLSRHPDSGLRLFGACPVPKRKLWGKKGAGCMKDELRGSYYLPRDI